MLDKLISQTLREQRDILAEAVVRRQLSRHPELRAQYGEGIETVSLRDTRFHLDYLAAAMGGSAPELFADYMNWTAVLLLRHNVRLEDLIATLGYLQEVLHMAFPETAHPILNTYIAAGITRLQSPAQPESFIDTGTPTGPLAEAYLEALLERNRGKAGSLVLEAVRDGMPVEDIYLQVFQQVLREIGRLWQTGQISVAHEHFATAATQVVMSQLYGHIFNTGKTGHKVVAASIGDELHEVGIRMVADFFEMAGWDTLYLGANTPVPDILRIADEHVADIVAISATMTVHIESVAQLIRALRASELKHIKVLVGGYPFKLAPDLWREVGADGYAPDAKTAVAVAQQLLN